MSNTLDNISNAINIPPKPKRGRPIKYTNPEDKRKAINERSKIRERKFREERLRLKAMFEQQQQLPVTLPSEIETSE
jgi:hypothetical protein